MIRISGLQKTFEPGTHRAVEALRRVDLEIRKGDLVIVMGPNGSGKSTLMNCITGKVVPDSGSVTINDTDITNWSEHKRSIMI
jgi:putative ABC transport system ATP-binding protein